MLSIWASHMKKFAELCLYQQCRLIFLAAVTNLVNTNVLMMWQKAQIFVLNALYFLFEPAMQFSILVSD